MSTLLHQLFRRQTCLASHCRPNRGREGAVRTHRNVGNSSSDAPEPDAASRGFIPTREAFEKNYHNLIVQSSAALLPSTSFFYRQPIVIFVTGVGGGAPSLPLLQQPLCQFLPAGLFLMIDTGLKTHLAVGSSKNSCLGTKQTTCSGGRRQQSIAVKNEGAGADILPLPLF